jgi:radical SAM superfamily enzyme YgiQ (UPF0313 family)
MNSESAYTRTALRVAMLACPYGDGPERIAPLGAMSVLSHAQAALGERIETMVFDFSSAVPDDLAALEPLLAWRPDVVGVPVYTNQVAIVDAWVAAVRRNLPNAVLVAGGSRPTLTATTYLARRAGLFDLLIRGDGEEPMTELLRRRLADHPGLDVPGATLLQPNGAVRHLPDSVPTAPDHMTDPFLVPIRHCNEELVFTDPRTGLSRSAIALASSRSCPLRCSFCAIIAMPGKWRAVPTERLMDWLCAAHRRDPFEHVYFMDANFFVVPARVREIASFLERRLPGVTWSASSTVGMLLKVAADLPALRRSGLRMVEMGIEAGSQRQLRFLNKQATVAQNLAAVRALQRHGIAIGVDFIMFYPDQTLEELRENLSFLRQADLTLQEDTGHLFNTLVLYPGTPIRDLYEAGTDRSIPTCCRTSNRCLSMRRCGPSTACSARSSAAATCRLSAARWHCCGGRGGNWPTSTRRRHSASGCGLSGHTTCLTGCCGNWPMYQPGEPWKIRCPGCGNGSGAWRYSHDGSPPLRGPLRARTRIPCSTPRGGGATRRLDSAGGPPGARGRDR